MRERFAELIDRLRSWWNQAVAGGGGPKRWLPVLGYAAFFLLVFVIAAYLTFPWDRLRDYVVQEVERPEGPGGVRRPSGWELDIVDLSPSWLTGVSATGVRLARRPEVPAAVEDDVPAAPMELFIDEASAHVSILQLLFGRLGVGLDAELAGGTLELDYAGGGLQDIDLELTGVQLRRLGILRAYLPVPLVGRISGDVELTLPEDPAEASGTVDLAIEGLTVGDGKAKLPVPGMGDGITLERVDAGDLALAGEITEGVLDLTTLAADGTDVEIAGDGTLRLADPLARSVLDLLLYVQVKDAYRDRNDRTRALFSLLEVSPDLRRARTDDGGLQFQLGGTVGGRLRSSPAGNRPRPGGG